MALHKDACLSLIPTKGHLATASSFDYQVLDATAFRNRLDFLQTMTRIESKSYEPARRYSMHTLRSIIALRGSFCIAAFSSNALIGFALGSPLEHFGHVAGITDDTEYGARTTLYCADTTVGSDFRQVGVARMLKMLQIDVAREHGFQYMSGRNRLMFADDMIALNSSLGASWLYQIPNAYHDELSPDIALYYQIKL